MPTIAGIPYRNDIAEAVAALPLGGILDRLGAPYPIVEAEATAPPVVVGRSIMQLFVRPDPEEEPVVTLGGIPQTRVAFGTEPGSGEYSVDFANSRIEFPPAQAGETYLLTYTGVATAISADLLNRWILATEETADAVALLDIGTTVQAYSATLDALAGTTPGTVGVDLLEAETAADGRGALDVYSEDEVDGLVAARLPRTAEIETKSANYELQATDAGKIIVFTATADLTIPSGLATGFQCVVAVGGAHDVEVVEGAGVTLASKGALLSGGGAAMTLIHLGSESWLGIGDGEEA